MDFLALVASPPVGFLGFTRAFVVSVVEKRSSIWAFIVITAEDFYFSPGALVAGIKTIQVSKATCVSQPTHSSEVMTKAKETPIFYAQATASNTTIVTMLL